MFMKRISAAAIITPLLLTACGGSSSSNDAPPSVDKTPETFSAEDVKAVVKHYGDIAFAILSDSVTTANTLQAALVTLTDTPTEANLTLARQAWLAARVPYQQSEAYRFGHVLFDDWEGQLNAWPLDEGLIDYVAASYTHNDNAGATLNIIANTHYEVNNETLDASMITTDLIVSLNELYGGESNVASGYHAVEFLLWGQDLHGNEAGAGERPATDFATDATCTNDNCDRRNEYLLATIELLLADLNTMKAAWAPDTTDNYRAEFEALDASIQLGVMLEGMGELAAGELAGERMNTALTQNSPEDEHDCFSDNTHNSHFYDMISIENVLLGQYESSVDTLNNVNLDGSAPSFMSLLTSAVDATTLTTLQTRLADAKASVTAIKTLAEHPTAPVKFDQMIATGEANAANRQIVQHAIDSLGLFTTALENAASHAKIERTNYTPK